MCSGMAIPMVGWLGAYVLVSRGLVRALVSTVPPMLVYLLWYAAYGRDATAQAPSAPEPGGGLHGQGLVLSGRNARVPGIGAGDHRLTAFSCSATKSPSVGLALSG